MMNKDIPDIQLEEIPVTVFCSFHRDLYIFMLWTSLLPQTIALLAFLCAFSVFTVAIKVYQNDY